MNKKEQHGDQYPLGAIVVDSVVCPIVATKDSATNCHVTLTPEAPEKSRKEEQA